jgi:C1A family cysteine protease
MKDNVRYADLGRLFIYYNERVIEHSVKSDSGAMLRDGIKTLAKQGVCIEKNGPMSYPGLRQNRTLHAIKKRGTTRSPPIIVS